MTSTVQLLDSSVLRRLADDMERISAGQGATAGDLALAPVLMGWHLDWRRVPVLSGTVAGHPRLRGGPVTTSQLVAFDVENGMWARTLNRWYALRGDGVPTDG